MPRILLFVCFLLTLVACEDDGGETTVYWGRNYFPLRVGQEAIYQVDSILYDDFSGRIDTLHFQRREKVESSYLDDTKQTVYRVEIAFRIDETSPWQTVEVQGRQLIDNHYESIVGNKRTVELIFPISDGKRWDVNAKNTEESREYRLHSVHQAFQLNDTSYFDSTATVLQEEEENLIERYFIEEKFATNVGMIYRRDQSLQTALNGNIESGYDVSIRLISFKQ
jgi:hypothetical protein